MQEPTSNTKIYKENLPTTMSNVFVNRLLDTISNKKYHKSGYTLDEINSFGRNLNIFTKGVIEHDVCLQLLKIFIEEELCPDIINDSNKELNTSIIKYYNYRNDQYKIDMTISQLLKTFTACDFDRFGYIKDFWDTCERSSEDLNEISNLFCFKDGIDADWGPNIKEVRQLIVSNKYLRGVPTESFINNCGIELSDLEKDYFRLQKNIVEYICVTNLADKLLKEIKEHEFYIPKLNDIVFDQNFGNILVFEYNKILGKKLDLIYVFIKMFESNNWSICNINTSLPIYIDKFDFQTYDKVKVRKSSRDQSLKSSRDQSLKSKDYKGRPKKESYCSHDNIIAKYFQQSDLDLIDILKDIQFNKLNRLINKSIKCVPYTEADIKNIGNRLNIDTNRDLEDIVRNIIEITMNAKSLFDIRNLSLFDTVSTYQHSKNLNIYIDYICQVLDRLSFDADFVPLRQLFNNNNDGHGNIKIIQNKFQSLLETQPWGQKVKELTSTYNNSKDLKVFVETLPNPDKLYFLLSRLLISYKASNHNLKLSLKYTPLYNLSKTDLNIVRRYFESLWMLKYNKNYCQQSLSSSECEYYRRPKRFIAMYDDIIKNL